jgi:hypothetical protein
MHTVLHQQVSFNHLHMCVHSICSIFTLLHPSIPLVQTSPSRTCSTPLFSNFVEEKRKKKMTYFR